MPPDRTVPTKSAIERAAGLLFAREAFIEKDWHVVRALRLLNELQGDNVRLAFSGGTSLLKSGLIKRFSEDVDLRVTVPATGQKPYRAPRVKIIQTLVDGGFKQINEPEIADGSRFFKLDFGYAPAFTGPTALRPDLRVEVRFSPPRTPVIMQPVQSLIGKVEGRAPEIPLMPYIDPVEIAADKLSALSWRLLDETERKDPSLIRHVYDLAALESAIVARKEFADLVRQSMIEDEGRGGLRDISAEQRLRSVVTSLRTKEWEEAYRNFALQMSFAPDDEKIPYAAALTACEKLIGGLLDKI